MLEGFVPYKKEVIDSYRAKGSWLGLTLADIFDRAAAKYPDQEAARRRKEPVYF